MGYWNEDDGYVSTAVYTPVVEEIFGLQNRTYVVTTILVSLALTLPCLVGLNLALTSPLLVSLTLTSPLLVSLTLTFTLLVSLTLALNFTLLVSLTPSPNPDLPG